MRKILRLLPDKLYISLLYYKHFKRFPNWKNPQTFNEKLQWLKINNRKPEYTTMVDKHLVKQYIADKIGNEYIIPTLGVWDTPEEIDFNSLPDRFVLKWNHDSGSIVICKDKSSFDKNEAVKKLLVGKKKNGFWYGREWPYKNVKPRIIAEQYITSDGEAPNDYKFFCFNGEVKCFKIDYDRYTNHRANYYSPSGELLRFGEVVCPPDFDRVVSLPRLKDKMIDLAEKLSAAYPFLRVDFYEIGDQIYFGELTFYPASGFGAFVPDEWDKTLGDLLELKTKK